MTENKHIRLTSTGHSSAKYGPCEICGHYVSEVFILADATGRTRFGHKGCLTVRQPMTQLDIFQPNKSNHKPRKE